MNKPSEPLPNSEIAELVEGLTLDQVLELARAIARNAAQLRRYVKTVERHRAQESAMPDVGVFWIRKSFGSRKGGAA